MLLEFYCCNTITPLQFFSYTWSSLTYTLLPASAQAIGECSFPPSTPCEDDLLEMRFFSYECCVTVKSNMRNETVRKKEVMLLHYPRHVHYDALIAQHPKCCNKVEQIGHTHGAIAVQIIGAAIADAAVCDIEQLEVGYSHNEILIEVLRT